MATETTETTEPAATARPASGPAVGMVRTTIGSVTLATALVGGLGIANPVLAAGAVAMGTGVLSGVGKVARNYLARPYYEQNELLAVLAWGVSWLG